MPTYEYACEACGHKFEEFQSIMAKPLTKCPVCKKKKVKRLISAGAGFIFKGSGFYITDYRSDNYKAGEKSESSSASGKTDGAKTESAKSESAGKVETKSESKSETKKETVKEAAPAPKTESKPAASSSSAKTSKK